MSRIVFFKQIIIFGIVKELVNETAGVWLLSETGPEI